MFVDREEAGEQLASLIDDQGLGSVDLVVAAPRGGMPVGRAVADAFDVPLDIVTGKKLTAPDHSDLSIGAVSADGALWLNDEMIHRMGVSESYLERKKAVAQKAAEAKREAYREVKSEEPVENRHVLVVDDGVATGATMQACVKDVRERGAAKVSVGVPVADPRGIASLGGPLEGVFTVRAPSDFAAVSLYYEDFHQLADREAMSYLLF